MLVNAGIVFISFSSEKKRVKIVLVGGTVYANPTHRVLPHSLIHLVILENPS